MMPSGVVLYATPTIVSVPPFGMALVRMFLWVKRRMTPVLVPGFMVVATLLGLPMRQAMSAAVLLMMMTSLACPAA